MQGLELAEKYYIQFGLPMLNKEFPHLIDKLAIGLCGSGSEAFGFDDELSRDHDFEPGFCIFIPDSEKIVSRRDEFLLERAYAKLPNEFLGFFRQRLSAVGGKRHGVKRMGDFFNEKIGVCDCDLSLSDWFSIPDYALAEATNGKIFYDNLGEFTKKRQNLLQMPDCVLKKKLAGNLLLAAQAGQYNYARCAVRGEIGASRLAMHEFVQATIKIIFLLNKKHCPFYKWQFASLKKLEKLSELAFDLELLLINSLSSDKNVALIEKISQQLCDELILQGLSKEKGSLLEAHAYSVNSLIKEEEIRNKSIFYAV